jgi:hypothetical protein
VVKVIEVVKEKVLEFKVFGLAGQEVCDKAPRSLLPGLGVGKKGFG